jgi:hypothetical protein
MRGTIPSRGSTILQGELVADETRRDERIRVSVDRWLQAAVEDAARRGLPELKPLLEGLALATCALRTADWNDTVPEPPGPAAE